MQARGSAKKANLLHFLTRKEYAILREFVLFMILKTDPKYHSQFIELFEYCAEEVALEKPPESSEFDLKALEQEKEQIEATEVGSPDRDAPLLRPGPSRGHPPRNHVRRV